MSTIFRFLLHLFITIVIIIVVSVARVSGDTSPIDQGRAALAHGDTDKAIELLEKEVAANPKNAEAHYVLATAYGSKAMDGGMVGGMKFGPKAMTENQKAADLDPKLVEPRYSLVQMYAAAPPMMGGSTDKALELAKEIKAIDPVYGHRAYAFVYAKQNKADLARKEYTDAIQEQPASAKAHSFYGQYLANGEKNYAAAFSEFEAALKVDPTYMAALYHLGRTAAQADSNLTRGEASLKKYLGYTPKPNEPPLANANYWLGMIYEKEGKKAEAKQSYEAALKINPSLKDAEEALKRVS